MLSNYTFDALQQGQSIQSVEIERLNGINTQERKKRQEREKGVHYLSGIMVEEIIGPKVLMH